MIGAWPSRRRACRIVDVSHPWPEQRAMVAPGPCTCGVLEVCPSCGEPHVRVAYCASCAAQWREAGAEAPTSPRGISGNFEQTPAEGALRAEEPTSLDSETVGAFRERERGRAGDTRPRSRRSAP